MPIQPYFPEPITVPGNVAEAKHKVRVGFVRRVVGWHFLTVAAVAFMAWKIPVLLSLGTSCFVWIFGLIALTISRRAFGAGLVDSLLITAVLPPSLFGLAQTLRDLHERGIPVVALVPAVAGFALYALLCGNDFSYVGQFVLCSGLTVVCVAVARIYAWMTPLEAWSGGVVAIAYLFYCVYDLSMVVKRRRPGEELGAAADLYRDLLNFVTYAVRVYLHWRKFRFI